MKVNIQYYDTESLTMEEVVAQAHHNYGNLAKVRVAPESSLPFDYIYFGIQNIITHKQLSLIYEQDSTGGSYTSNIKELRAEVLKDLEEIVDQVITDNESKVT